VTSFPKFVEVEMKFDPTTLRVKSEPPCLALFGDIAAIVGSGFGELVETPPLPPPPPQLIKPIVPRRART